MTDGFRVCVFVPVTGDGDASAGVAAAIRIASELGVNVQVHPMALHPNSFVGVDDNPGTVKVASGRYDTTGG